ncbi:RagB/SusD domain-containing protein [Russula earlei]|uniref:RagB/SusD domain-containing protein n=1 Tax=Russula earlei TaxID=71964 RepID=A0ACC0TZR5_9AGAM|nr:RagB/SusD domain-containing protein [Russula earlei]
MKKLIIFSIIIAITGVTACKKILDRVDFSGVPSTAIWNDPNTANLYLNYLYTISIPVWPSDEGVATLPTSIHNVSDDANGTANSVTAILNGTLTVDQISDFYTGASGAYFKIRQINTLLSSIDGGSISDSLKNVMKAQAYFLRAYNYFQLVKLYGGVPYITFPQDWLADNLLVSRNSTSQCVDSMVADLNHCSVLPANWTTVGDVGRITRGAALAMKGRILLYWASPQFNPTNDMSRWQRALTANKNAYDTLTLDGYGLYANFSRIFIDAYNTTDKEPILFRSYNGTTTTGLYNSYDNVTRPYSQTSGSGGKTNNPTWNLVKAFPMKDGKIPGDPTSAYSYTDTTFWKNRDPRFYATIVYNGAVWGLGSTPGRKQWMYPGITEDKSAPTTTGFYSRKNIDSTVTSTNTQYGKTAWVELRFAEVMLNYAECANAMSDPTTPGTMIGLIRKRAGIPAGADGSYGIGTSLSTGQMQLAINLERRIEFAFEGKRYDDLRRTKTFDQLNGTFRNQLVIALRPGVTVATLEAAYNGGKIRDTINVDNSAAKYFAYSIAPITAELAINFLPAYYAYGIPSSNILKDPNMAQTVNWTYAGGAGTFDPTK